ncbi:sulfite exporter TauE/SafE family protein [Prosthecochloris vibrioformis]|uniref:Probable membrane transporter protein n=1 Tax=Prosthecochloris vibrioformis TaxID=1098 RepID=A0A5C4RZJ3_PROVB|nr:sulfite exporter TauE/SafE family protein [Prosthecochloris vibrioformis]TNJ36544.1 sulfite exporter TauE/SafE family protein [Prosthecochloris vibrioformis]
MKRIGMAAVLSGSIVMLLPGVAHAAAAMPGGELAWWIWVCLLFVFSFFLGIIAVIAGVGGGVLFVPIVSSFFPFHIDFVRAAGLLVALSGALSAGAPLLRSGMANLRLGLPMALLGSVSSIFGALIGLLLPAAFVQLLLGIVIIGIAVLMIMSKRSALPQAVEPDCFSQLLSISGVYHDTTLKQAVSWNIHRTALGGFLFIFIGFIGGMFGLGAGFANVPVFNLLMGVPLKVSVATSGLVLSINGSAAAWVYLLKGAVLPLIAIPAVVGMMLGSRIGAWLLPKFHPKSIRLVVISILVLAGIRSLLKGLGI